MYVIAYYSVWSYEIWDFDSNDILTPTVAIFTENILVLKILLPANIVTLGPFSMQIAQKEGWEKKSIYLSLKEQKFVVEQQNLKILSTGVCTSYSWLHYLQIEASFSA